MQELPKVLIVSSLVLLGASSTTMAYEGDYSQRVIKVKKCYYNYSHTIRYCYYKSVSIPTQRPIVRENSFEQKSQSYYQFNSQDSSAMGIRRYNSFYHNEPSFFESY